jgi:hypothetical protein
MYLLLSKQLHCFTKAGLMDELRMRQAVSRQPPLQSARAGIELCRDYS